jgi:hypothetical protein
MTQAKSTLRETPLPIPTLCKADGKQLTLDLENMSQSAGPSSQRRKTTEACSPCRARKLKVKEHLDTMDFRLTCTVQRDAALRVM